MLISISFRFTGDPSPSAVTGVEGDIADVLLPCVGDLVEHVTPEGIPFSGRVAERVFRYEMPNSSFVSDGSISVTLLLDRNVIH